MITKYIYGAYLDTMMKHLSKPIANTIVLFALFILVSACTSPTPAISSTSTPVPPSPTATSPIAGPPTAVLPTSPPAKNTPLPPTENALPISTISDVPVGAPVALDGSLSPGEWEHGLRQEFSDDGELFLMQDGRYLYLGIHENFNDLTVTSVFLEFGDEISVMHSSGSLGTAIFKRSDEGWLLTQPFSWSLYQVTSLSAEDEKKRQDFLAANGWLANLGSMTETSEIEYQITIPDGPFRIAVSYLRPPNFSQPAWWPAGLSDDCLNVKLLQANVAEKLNPPLLLQFTPETWMTFDIPYHPSSAPAGQVIFYSERDGDAEIYIMYPDGSNQRPLTDNDADDYSPSWSPDGAQIVFESDRDDPHPHTCFPNCNNNLYLMDADGNNVRQLTALPGAEWGATWSPDGKSLLFTAGEIGYKAYGIYTIGLNGSEPQPLLVDDFNNDAPDWSPDGKQIAFSSNRDGNQDIFVMNADGSNVHKIVDTGLNDYFPDWSPDGTQIAFFAADWPSVKQDIYTVNADGSNWVNLTNTPGVVDEDPKWSPDGNQIIFQSDRDGNFEIYVMNADGSQPNNLTRNPEPDYWPDWFIPSPAKIAFVSDHSGRQQIYLMPVPGAQTPSIVPVSDWQPLTSGGQDNYFPAWSPDGKQIAFYTHFSWQSWAIKLVNADSSNSRQLTSDPG